MAALSFADLGKTFSSRHPDSGKQRYTKVVSKIANGETFEMVSGKPKTLEYANKKIADAFKKGDLEKIRGNQKLFKESGKTTIIRLDQLKKTKEFGGGGGSGAGADVTALVEAAQCLYCALVWYVFKRPMKLDELVTPKQFEQAAKHIDVDIKLEKMINDLPEDWVTSSILGANELYKRFKSNNKKYVFHRGSKTVGKIEDAFKAVNRKEKAFGDINKWSPADIYMVGPKADVVKLEKTETLKGLNGEMLKQYTAQELIGVSLKKMVTKAKYSEVNVNKTKGSKKNTDVAYKEFFVKANVSATPYDSMDVYIRWGNSKKERIQFRSFGTGDGLTGWQGELKGETANQGKVSLGPISFIVKQHTGVQLPESAAVAKRVRDEDSKLVDEIYDLAKKLKVNNLPDKKEHMKLAMAKEQKWRYSKYLGMLLLVIIESQTKATRNQIIYDIYSYAGSKSSFSAPYAKIEG